MHDSKSAIAGDLVQSERLPNVASVIALSRERILELRSHAAQACYSDDVSLLRKIFQSEAPMGWINWTDHENRYPLLAFAVGYASVKCTEECLRVGADPDGAAGAFQPGAREVIPLGGARTQAPFPHALRMATPFGTGGIVPKDTLVIIKGVAKSLSLCLQKVVQSGAHATSLPRPWSTTRTARGDIGAASPDPRVMPEFFLTERPPSTALASASRAHSGSRSRAASGDAGAGRSSSRGAPPTPSSRSASRGPTADLPITSPPLIFAGESAGLAGVVAGADAAPSIARPRGRSAAGAAPSGAAAAALVPSNHPLGPGGYPLLSLAHGVAELGLPMPIRAMIQAGVDLGAKDVYGWTVAQVALRAAQRAQYRNARELESILHVYYAGPNPLDVVLAPHTKASSRFWVLSREEALQQLHVPTPRMWFPLQAEDMPAGAPLVWIMPAGSPEMAARAAAFCRMTRDSVSDRWGVSLKGNAVTARVWQTGVLDGSSVEVMHLEHCLPEKDGHGDDDAAAAAPAGEPAVDVDDEDSDDDDDDMPASRGATAAGVTSSRGTAAGASTVLTPASIRGMQPTRSLGDVIAVFARPREVAAGGAVPSSTAASTLPAPQGAGLVLPSVSRVASLAQPRHTALPPDLPPRPGFAVPARPATLRVSSDQPGDDAGISAAAAPSVDAAALPSYSKPVISAAVAAVPDVMSRERSTALVSGTAASAVGAPSSGSTPARGSSPAMLRSVSAPLRTVAVVAGSEGAVSQLARVLQARWPVAAPVRRFVAIPLYGLRQALTGRREAQAETRLRPVPLLPLGDSACSGAAALWHAGEVSAFDVSGTRGELADTWASIFNGTPAQDHIAVALRALRSSAAGASRGAAASAASAASTASSLPADADEVWALAYFIREERVPSADPSAAPTGAGAGAGAQATGGAPSFTVRCHLPSGCRLDGEDKRPAAARILQEETGALGGNAAAGPAAAATEPSPDLDAYTCGVLPFDSTTFIQLLRARA